MKDEQKTQDQLIAELAALHQRVADLETLNSQHQQTEEARFRQMLEEVKDYAIFMQDADGYIVSWNAGVERILGYQEAEFLGQPACVIFTPEDVEQGADEQEMSTAAATGRAQDERWHIRKDGTRFWASGVMTALHDETGTLTGFVKVMRDLTERKLLEEERTHLLQREQDARQELEKTLGELQKSEARFRRIFESGVVGMLFTNLSGTITDANDTFLQMVGYTQAELQAGTLRWDEMTPPEYAHLDQDVIKELKQNGICTPYEKEYIRKDGSRIPVVLGSGLLEESEETAFAFVLDISKRKWAEKALSTALRDSRHYAAQLRGLMKASLAINSAGSLDEMLTVITQQARSLIGAYQAITNVLLDQERRRAIDVVASSDNHVEQRQHDEELDGSDIYTLIRRLKQPLHMTIAELQADPVWYKFSQRSSQYLPMQGVLMVPLLGRNGQTIGLVHVCDKYEGEFTEEDEVIIVQLAQMASVALENARLYRAATEANQIKDEFLSICSHELRTPLNSILGWSKLLRSRKYDEATTARALETIERNASSQAQLIEDLLDISRIMTGKVRLSIHPVELTSVIRMAIETVYLAAEAKAIQIESVLDETIGPILGDRDRLQQIVWNLLTNAIKFTPKDGRVEVHLKHVKSYVEIVVSDTGQGISADFLPHIFERFRQADSTSTRAHAGLGLGLAIVRHLVELHGGTIRAESLGLDQGATFTVRLPLTAIRIEHGDLGVSEALTQSLEQSDCFLRLDELRVLVVDDENDARELLTTVLEHCGAEVIAVASAEEAFQEIERSKPDVLLSDIGMPGEDGYALIRRVRALELHSEDRLPAAALTAYARPEDRTAALLAGFQSYLTKPIVPTELIAVVGSLAGRT